VEQDNLEVIRLSARVALETGEGGLNGDDNPYLR
jgi:hypothetical protein